MLPKIRRRSLPYNKIKRDVTQNKKFEIVFKNKILKKK